MNWIRGPQGSPRSGGVGGRGSGHSSTQGLGGRVLSGGREEAGQGELARPGSLGLEPVFTASQPVALRCEPERGCGVRGEEREQGREGNLGPGVVGVALRDSTAVAPGGGKLGGSH